MPSRSATPPAGGEPGRLGYPTGHPVVAHDGIGRASPFQHGRISWHPSIGARLVGAAIAKRYVALQAESGRLGYPRFDEAAVATGVAAIVAFQQGRITWSAATGAIETYDVIAAAYARSGAEKGPLGLPVASEQAVVGGRAQRFQTGRISAGGAPAPSSPAARSPTKYVELGAETGQLGWPTTNEYVPSPGQRHNDFQHGSITYDEVTEEVTVLPLP